MLFTLQHTLRFVDVGAGAGSDRRAHLVGVETIVRSDVRLPGPLVLFMPVWTPGSYLVREYARHIESLTGRADGVPCAALKIRKNAWRVGHAGASEIAVRYRVYCNELTVRTNHVDESHAFLNGAALFLAIDGHEDATATIDVEVPRGWQLMTALDGAAPPELPPLSPPSVRGDAVRSVRLFARDLDALVDGPIELGVLRKERVQVQGVPHDISLWPAPRATDAQVASLLRDFAILVETESAWFGGTLPYDRYTLFLHFSPRARGGLEHLSSAALIADPSSFATRDGYLDLLSLVAHELFHAWNVKRIRPMGLFPYRYQEENYTRLLWWFEGATSYYDWRALRVSKLCTVEEYLDHLAGEILALDRVHGRLVQSLEEASFDAWIKLYRPDENTENSTVSYYRKGEIVCALLDIEIRARSANRASLDHALFHLWEHYGKPRRPVPEDGFQAILEEATHVPLGDVFDAWIRSPGDIDYDTTLAHVGMRVDRDVREPKDSAQKNPRAALGIRARIEGGKAIVATVARGRAAQLAGIDAGDEIVAVGGRRVEAGSLEGALASRVPLEEVEVTVGRDGRVFTLTVLLEEARPEKIRIRTKADAPDSERSLALAWLGDAHPMWSRS
jgi:predicted metalloprotease with PDZ domain